MGCTDPNGCSLEGSEMVERVRAWREVSTRAITREVGATTIRSEYPPDPLLAQRLRGLIAAEATCCSFLTFDLREERERIVVELEFPPTARALVESVMVLPGPAARRGLP